MIRVTTVFGTRPEVIKLAPVMREIERRSEVFTVVNILTAQHREMLDPLLGVFGLKVHHDLNVMRPGQGLADIVVRTLQALPSILEAERPDLVLVQGDTCTSFGAALAAYYLRIPVGHVEAGLRTRNKYCPYPEEINRRLIGSLADLHFAPTQEARRNLLVEGVAAERIFVTGNTVVDALLAIRERKGETPNPCESDPVLRGQRLILLTAHRRESHGSALQKIFQAVRMIVQRNPEVAVVFPVHMNPVVQEASRAVLAGVERVRLIPPLAYHNFIGLMEHAELILTDSGGIQEEAPSLGKPVVILREETERGEIVEAGGAVVVGTDPVRIVETVEAILNDPSLQRRMGSVGNPFGDGNASLRIVEAILAELPKLRGYAHP